ncbi:MAG: tyrosine-type recombinase/integrase, partial [Pseudonocardiaceae bacterium]
VGDWSRRCQVSHIERRQRKLGDGSPGPVRWRVRYTTPAGEERNRTFDRKVDAERFVLSVDSDKARGRFIDPRSGNVGFAAFVEHRYRPTMIDLEPSTRARDESYLRTHILPTFGPVPLASIDYGACQAWVSELSTRRAPATVVKAAQIMNKVMAAAVRSQAIAVNPMDEVRLPTVEESEDVYLTPAQVRQLADAMQEVAPRYRAMVYVGCYAGPRIGELAALRWYDVDLLHRTISITRKVIEVTGLGLLEGSTKTKAGRRTVTIPRLVAEELDRHRSQFPSDGLVFTSPSGTQVRANNLRRRAWAAAVQLAGLEPAPTFHDMRHTAVSLWIAAGASDLEVAKWAGHRSASFTKDRYAHLFPEHGAALADRLDAFIAAATSTPAAGIAALRPRG